MSPFQIDIRANGPQTTPRKLAFSPRRLWGSLALISSNSPGYSWVSLGDSSPCLDKHGLEFRTAGANWRSVIEKNTDLPGFIEAEAVRVRALVSEYPFFLLTS